MRNAFVISYRLLREHLAYTAISAFGFGISISLLLLVVSFAWDRLSRDQFHPAPDRMYRVETKTDPVPDPYASSPAPLSQTLAESGTGVEAVTHLRPSTRTFVDGTDRFAHQATFVTPSFFDVFGFPVEGGDARSALSDPRSVILSSATARTLFGTTDVVGRSVTLADGGDFIVRGVINTKRWRTHLSFDALYPMDADPDWDRRASQWNEYQDGYTYLRLEKGASPEAVSAQIQAMAAPHWSPEASRLDKAPEYAVQPLSDVLFGPGAVNEMGGETIPDFVMYFLGVLSLVVIATATFNYVSLGIVQSLRRAREVGIRKALGATRAEIAGQFLAESVGVALLAFVVAIGATAGLLPLFNRLEIVQELNAQISMRVFLDPWFHAVGLSIVLAVGALAAAYPALSLASHRPVQVLRGSVGRISTPDSPRWMPSLRQGLMGAQLALSIAFLLLSITLYRQSQMVVQADYGYPTESIFSVELPTDPSGRMADELRREGFVQAVGYTSHVPVNGAWGVAVLRPAGTDAEIRAARYGVDSTFFEVMDLTFEKQLPDVYRRFASGGVILNQVAARRIAQTGAEGGLGATVRMGSTDREVVGVVHDFRFRDLTTPIGPLVLEQDSSRFRHVIARTAGADPRRVSEAVEATWAQVHPSSPFTLAFLDETIADRYMPYRDLTRILGLIGLYAVAIACLGILGMTAYSVQQRTREIGIRKAVGATPLDILRVLLRETGIVFGAAVLVGLPLGMYVNTLWLPNFAERVTVGPGTYGAAVGITAILALGTAGMQALHGANQDVVRSLRDASNG